MMARRFTGLLHDNLGQRLIQRMRNSSIDRLPGAHPIQSGYSGDSQPFVWRGIQRSMTPGRPAPSLASLEQLRERLMGTSAGEVRAGVASESAQAARAIDDSFAQPSPQAPVQLQTVQPQNRPVLKRTAIELPTPHTPASNKSSPAVSLPSIASGPDVEDTSSSDFSMQPYVDEEPATADSMLMEITDMVKPGADESGTLQEMPVNSGNSLPTGTSFKPVAQSQNTEIIPPTSGREEAPERIESAADMPASEAAGTFAKVEKPAVAPGMPAQLPVMRQESSEGTVSVVQREMNQTTQPSDITPPTNVREETPARIESAADTPVSETAETFASGEKPYAAPGVPAQPVVMRLETSERTVADVQREMNQTTQPSDITPPTNVRKPAPARMESAADTPIPEAAGTSTEVDESPAEPRAPAPLPTTRLTPLEDIGSPVQREMNPISPPADISTPTSLREPVSPRIESEADTSTLEAARTSTEVDESSAGLSTPPLPAMGLTASESGGPSIQRLMKPSTLASRIHAQHSSRKPMFVARKPMTAVPVETSVAHWDTGFHSTTVNHGTLAAKSQSEDLLETESEQRAAPRPRLPFLSTGALPVIQTPESQTATIQLSSQAEPPAASGGPEAPAIQRSLTVPASDIQSEPASFPPVLRREAEAATPVAPDATDHQPLTTKSAPAVDVDGMAREVYQILSRRLRVEYERARGWSG